MGDGIETNKSEIKPRKRNPVRQIALHVQRTLGAGLLVVLPIGITLLVLKFFFELLDPTLQPLLEFLPGKYVTGSGIVGFIVILYVIGMVASHVIGRRLISLGHLVMERIPVIRSIYGTTRSGIDMLAGVKDSPYRGVVLVEWPRRGMRVIGLVTAHIDLNDGQEMMFVYIPTTPVPSSGFLVLVGHEDVTPVDMTVDDAVKIIISGCILAGDWLNSSNLAGLNNTAGS